MLTGTPDSRSRLKGRLRSFSPAATLTARLHPATDRLTRITTSASCCHWAISELAFMSARVAGGLWYGAASSRSVRARSIADVAPLVATSIHWTGSFCSRAGEIATVGQTATTGRLPPPPWRLKSDGTAATCAPAAQLPSATVGGVWPHKTTLM